MAHVVPALIKPRNLDGCVLVEPSRAYFPSHGISLDLTRKAWEPRPTTSRTEPTVSSDDLLEVATSGSRLPLERAKNYLHSRVYGNVIPSEEAEKGNERKILDRDFFLSFRSMPFLIPDPRMGIAPQCHFPPLSVAFSYPSFTSQTHFPYFPTKSWCFGQKWSEPTRIAGFPEPLGLTVGRTFAHPAFGTTRKSTACLRPQRSFVQNGNTIYQRNHQYSFTNVPRDVEIVGQGCKRSLSNAFCSVAAGSVPGQAV